MTASDTCYDRWALNSPTRACLTEHKRGKRHFLQKTFTLGAGQNFRWDKALATAEALEDEELARKLSLRK